MVESEYICKYLFVLVCWHVLQSYNLGWPVGQNFKCVEKPSKSTFALILSLLFRRTEVKLKIILKKVLILNFITSFSSFRFFLHNIVQKLQTVKSTEKKVYFRILFKKFKFIRYWGKKITLIPSFNICFYNQTAFLSFLPNYI